MINWQLSKKGIRWLVSFDRIAGSGVDPSRSVFFKVIRWQVTSFQAIAGSSIIFFKKSIWNMLCLFAAQLKFWFQTDLGCENSASYARKTVAFNHPSAPQENQCLLSHFLTTLGAQEKTDCSSMLWSIWIISMDQSTSVKTRYPLAGHLTVSRAQVSTHRGRVLLWSYPLTSY